MKARLGLLLFAFAMLSARSAWSQAGVLDLPENPLPDSSQQPSDSSQQSSDSSQQSGPQPAYTHPEQLPPLGLLGEVASETGLRFGLSTGMFYDTSGGFSATPQPATYFFLTPSIAITQIRPTLAWTASYSGGLSINNYSTYSSSSSSSSVSSYLAQAGLIDILYQLSPRWQLHAHDGYTYSDDPFTPYLTYMHDPTPSQPNPTIYVPQSIGQSNRALLDLNYTLGAHDVLTFSGTESFNRYTDTTYTGYNNFTWGGRANYQHAFNARFSAGGGYNFTALDFAHGTSRSGIQMLQAYTQYQVTPTMSIAGWMGPQDTHTKDIVPQFCFQGQCYGYTVSHQQQWNVAYGADYSWSGQYNALRASFSSQVTDGGGTLGTVKLYLASGNYTRRLSPRNQLTAGVLYGNNRSTSLYYADRTIDSVVGSVTLKRQINPAWMASVTYGYLYETQKNIYAYPTWQGSRVGFRLQYMWGHSLGR